MNIITIDEHSFCPDLLPEKAVILDVGCRGLGFARYFRALGHKVTAIDIGHLPEYPEYVRVGLSTINGKAYVSHDNDEQAMHLIYASPFKKDAHVLANNETYVVTLATLEKEFNNGNKFDLIKLDIEGEEYPVLKSATHPIAKQISVEFHAHTGENTKQELDDLLDWLSEWYAIHNRVWEKRHGCSENYWDILCVSK